MPYKPYIDADVTVNEDYIVVSDGTALKTIEFVPAGDTPEKPVVIFVAGWISSISGWKDVLKQLTHRYRTL